MKDPFRQSLVVSTVMHALVIGAVIGLSFMSGCFDRRPKELVTFIDLQVALPPPPAVEAVPDIRPPPPVPKPPAPLPEPKPEPKPAPKPPQPKPAIEKSTNLVRFTDRPVPKAKTPPLSAEEIRKLLAAGARISDQTFIPTDDFSFAWYYALVRKAMYDAWNQPSEIGTGSGLTAAVTVRVERDGAITRREMVRPSGNRLMDDSVRQAVQAVSRLQPLPPAFGGRYKDITIEFELTGASL